MSKKIFVVEDDADLSEAIQLILNEEGYQTVASYQKNSIKGVILHMPDLVLVDNKLTDGFGSELCAAIKLHPLTSHIPVILISGYADLADIAAACGADAYLNKPFELTTLIELVSRYLKKAA
ncbi:Response regulator receiver domain-containing protein [Mucilaginibacter pineti]|uniref:Response regulator receiver domain-containing protein n=1 Tax=Mucilaginibacter pineti TaxID=1391627 RepID=A0A1G6SYW5_9SPHI|nr:response regulator [Mucilaginibacter pineti]SDD21939.1 Response regulator receiver domain-containing protein [Mucilaginibacter pineti]